jgi:hypothetical protein
MEDQSSPEGSITLVNVQLRNKSKKSKSKDGKNESRTPSPSKQNKKVSLKNKIKSNVGKRAAATESKLFLL